MSKHSLLNRLGFILRRLAMALLLVLLVMGVYNIYRPLPPGVDFKGPLRAVSDVRFLADLTYTNAEGERRTQQVIFDEVFRLIENAREFVLLDMFLVNSCQGELEESHRPLSSQLTDRLIRQQQSHPDMQILVITDPLNTVYGGVDAEH